MKSRLAPAILATTLLIAGLARHATAQPDGDEPSWKAFFAAAGNDEGAARQALDEIGRRWRPGYAALLLDLARLLPSARAADTSTPSPARWPDDPDSGSSAAPRAGEFPSAAPVTPGAKARRRLITFLEQRTGQKFGDDLRAWRRWLWSRSDPPHAEYAAFKAELYSRIDPGFRAFFPAGVRASIRLDEIDWGGTIRSISAVGGNIRAVLRPKPSPSPSPRRACLAEARTELARAKAGGHHARQRGVHAERRMTAPASCRGVAPSARRTPNSAICCVTPYEITL